MVEFLKRRLKDQNKKNYVSVKTKSILYVIMSCLNEASRIVSLLSKAASKFQPVYQNTE